MARPKRYANAAEYERARRADPRRRAYVASKKPVRAFRGIDGEGGYLTPDGRQEYLILRAGDRVLETGKPLTPLQCLAFIATLDPDIIWVSYFFDYDVTMMVRDLPLDKWLRLLNRSVRINHNTGAAFGVDVFDGLFQIDYIPTKEFRVRQRGRKWVTIHDTGSFFQASFVSTLMQWFAGDESLTPVIDKIAEGKTMRNDFGAVTEYERGYNKLEVIMLAKLMERFRGVLADCDIPMPTKWQGPGNIASSLFNKNGIPKRATHGKSPEKGKHLTIAQDYPHVVLLANKSYYGGRFEPLRMGWIQGPIYQKDINSAYAAMYGLLPCLLHGKWRRIRTKNPPRNVWNDTYFAEVKYDHWPEKGRAHGMPRPVMGVFPQRTDKGTIRFPLRGHGVFTGPEIRLAVDRGVQLDFIGGYEYVRCCECVPFHWVPELYRQRKAPGQGIRARIFKLALASIYGKLAQSVGDPVYSNPIWASLITGTVRAQLARAALSVNDGRNVIMLATDGIFTTEDLAVPVGPNLGEWDHKEHPEMFVVQSGVYFCGEEKPKTRGVPMKLLESKRADLRERWTHYLETGVFDAAFDSMLFVERRTFTGLRMASHLNRPEKAGTWADEPRAVAFNWHQKREGGAFDMMGQFRTLAPLDSPETVYYSKDIGGMSGDSMIGHEDMIESEQPDWVDTY